MASFTEPILEIENSVRTARVTLHAVRDGREIKAASYGIAHLQLPIGRSAPGTKGATVGAL